MGETKCPWHEKVQNDLDRIDSETGQLQSEVSVLRDRSDRAQEGRSELFHRMNDLERTVEGINVKTAGLWGLPGTFAGAVIVAAVTALVAFAKAQGASP